MDKGKFVSATQLQRTPGDVFQLLRQNVTVGVKYFGKPLAAIVPWERFKEFRQKASPRTSLSLLKRVARKNRGRLGLNFDSVLAALDDERKGRLS